jgi:hypothetical protein
MSITSNEWYKFPIENNVYWFKSMVWFISR